MKSRISTTTVKEVYLNTEEVFKLLKCGGLIPKDWDWVYSIKMTPYESGDDFLGIKIQKESSKIEQEPKK